MSSRATGKSGYAEHLFAFHFKEIRRPVSPAHHPDPGHLVWHAREVFKGEELPCLG